MIKIALDAIGGDKGPEVLVEGALQALENIESHIILVGDKDQLSSILARHSHPQERVEIVHANEVVGMDVKPKDSLRMRKSSIAVAANLVARGEASAVVSAGNTGAAAAATLVKWRTLKGISRPGIGSFFPTHKDRVFFLDIGGTVNCKPRNIFQFAIMGSAYCSCVLGIEKPRVGLLSIGEEATKGNDVTFETYELLKNSTLNFCGNAEGRDILSGNFDVVACDGFIGNIVLKFGESVVELIMSSMKEEFRNSSPITKLAAMTIKPTLRDFKKRLDYAEIGGAPLLGLNGTCIICHGSSNIKAITNAIVRAEETITHDLGKHIIELVEKNQDCGGSQSNLTPETQKA